MKLNSEIKCMTKKWTRECSSPALEVKQNAQPARADVATDPSEPAMGIESSAPILLICNSWVSWFDKFPAEPGSKEVLCLNGRKASPNVNGTRREREIYIIPWSQVYVTGPRHYLTSGLRVRAQGNEGHRHNGNMGLQVWSVGVGCAARCG